MTELSVLLAQTPITVINAIPNNLNLSTEYANARLLQPSSLILASNVRYQGVQSVPPRINAKLAPPTTS